MKKRLHFSCCMWLILFNTLITIVLVYGSDSLRYHQPNEILDIIESSCFIAAVTKNAKYLSLLEELSEVFGDDTTVRFGRIENILSFHWPNGETLLVKDSSSAFASHSHNQDIVLFPKIVKDRTCLLSGATSFYNCEYYVGQQTLSSILDYVNSKCGTFRTLTGKLNIQGLHRQYILNNLFHASNASNVSFSNFYKSNSRPQQSLNLNDKIKDEVKMRYTDSDHDENFCDGSTNNEGDKTCTKQDSLIQQTQLHKCNTISSSITKKDFFQNYIKHSKPVIIKNAIHLWPAMKKWTNEFLRKKYGHKVVHIKLAPGGDYEGVEKADLWSDFKTFKIPDKVRKQLKFPDLVVVRPATLNVNFSKFLDMIEQFSTEKGENGTAYLEYSSIREYMPELEEDLLPFTFWEDKMLRKHLNIWLSDGHTLGRLHFDPFDNLLCQISGRKQVTLFDPHNNERLYEAHIPEASLSYDKHTKTFQRKARQDSTSMVMSPVDLKNPDLQRFPLFSDAVALNCTIDEGDVLYMPAFWWHEVQSSPSLTQHRNLAVNFWYEPFLRREFPCADCRLDVNPAYHHLLG